MNVKKWMWCLHCERCFEVYVDHEPQAVPENQPGGLESPFDFAADIEMQLGVEQGGTVYAECPYPDCDGSLLDFWWWEAFRDEIGLLPEVPELEKVYHLN